MDKSFTKLSNLVGQQFTVEKVAGYKFKMWSTEEGKMIVQDEPEKGFRKLYQVDTDKGLLDLSQSQMGTLLEGVSHVGKSDIIGATFDVKSNGKSGMEIRYYLNPVRNKPAGEPLPEPPLDIPESW
jgi:hypothetical protein